MVYPATVRQIALDTFVEHTNDGWEGGGIGLVMDKKKVTNLEVCLARSMNGFRQSVMLGKTCCRASRHTPRLL